MQQKLCNNHQQLQQLTNKYKYMVQQNLLKIYKEYMLIRNKFKIRNFQIWSINFVRRIKFNMNLYDFLNILVIFMFKAK